MGHAMALSSRLDSIRSIRSAMDHLQRDVKNCDLDNIIGMAEYVGMVMGLHIEAHGEKGENDMFKFKGRLDNINSELIKNCKLIKN